MNCTFCKYKIQATKKISTFPICINCYNKAYNIKCSSCSKKIKYDEEYYSKYPDFKNVFKKSIDKLAHWIKFGYKEQRCISTDMKWRDNNITCNSCFNQKTKEDQQQYENDSNEHTKIEKKKKFVLIAFCQPEWNSEKLNILYNFLIANYDNNLYHFVVYNFVFPNGFGYLNNDMINIYHISSTYDILIMGNSYNASTYNYDWYNICIDMLKANKSVSIVSTRTCSDFFCPTSHSKDGMYTCKMMRDNNLYIEEHSSILEKIVLFLPRIHYYEYIPYYYGYNDGNYIPEAYKNYKKILLDPIIIDKSISKDDFYKKYEIPKDKKIISIFFGKSDQTLIKILLLAIQL